MRNLTLLIFLMLATLGAYAADVVVGAARPYAYLPLLQGKRVALFSNHTGVVDLPDGSRMHTLDYLLRDGVDVRLILSPEHGFRGTAAEGQTVANDVDSATGIPIFSLYGKTKGAKRLAEMPKDIDVIICDIQDVGLRFYTYYISMIETMEYASANGLEYIVFDRPNPLGMTVDGPILDMALRSGVGRLPIPVVHGLTLGELARMAWGEQWLDGQTTDSRLSLTVIPCLNYTHSTRYRLPINPSPNLRTMEAIYLYPSTCLFEGTIMSLGRGTDNPFTVYGHPDISGVGFYFIPRTGANGAKPVLADRKCYGFDLSTMDPEEVISRGVDLTYLISAYNNDGMRKHRKEFFTTFFDKLIGNRNVRRMIETGRSAGEIKATWVGDVEQFKTRRQPYLLYPL
ncbi:MAG: DUF1343 domain-containing protein [Paramuribaculum sp.]|nr:DUF1343 domain-containing protein [Paramuribaculum sp.]